MKGGTLAVSVAVYFTKARNFKQKGQNVNICLSLVGDTQVMHRFLNYSVFELFRKVFLKTSQLISFVVILLLCCVLLTLDTQTVLVSQLRQIPCGSAELPLGIFVEVLHIKILYHLEQFVGRLFSVTRVENIKLMDFLVHYSISHWHQRYITFCALVLKSVAVLANQIFVVFSTYISNVLNSKCLQTIYFRQYLVQSSVHFSKQL